MAAGLVALASVAGAQSRDDERIYVVVPGDTILRIAARLGVQPRELAAHNSLPRPYTLRVGRRLRVPPDADPEAVRDLPTRRQLAEAREGTAPEGATPTRHRAGFVTLVRQRDGAELATSFAAGGPSLRVRVEHFLRSRDGREHLVHPRLMRAIASVSDRFGGRRIVVLSGFRPRARDRERSRHAQGYAVDLRVEGVSSRDLHRFCTTLANMGCGHYPRANFVHLDVRREPASWSDGAPWSARSTRVVPEDGDVPEESVAEVHADAAQE